MHSNVQQKMGGLASSMKSNLFCRPAMRTLMFGFVFVGKTSILYKLKLDEIVTAIPTDGINFETIKHKNISFAIEDIAGKDKFQEMHSRIPHQDVRALILVIDSSDMNQVDWVLLIIGDLLMNDSFRNAPLLIFANKQDVSGVLTVAEWTGILSLDENELLAQRPWKIQGCCGLTGRGLKEGMDWLAGQF